MLKAIFEFTVYLFALYGAVILILGTVGSVCRSKSCDNLKIRMVLVVKNAENVIEGIVRNVFLGGVLGIVMSQGRLTIIDMGSTDSTQEILNKLKNDYEVLDVLGTDEKEKVFTAFSQEQN